MATTAGDVAGSSPPDIRRGNATRRFRQRNEAARDRDVFRHLCAWQAVHRPAAIQLNTATKLASAPLAQQCPDKALTALAKLGALQFNARTCLVSMLCRTTEYVLADVSQTTALQRRGSQSPDTCLWLGTTSFDRKDGLATHAIDEWQKAKRPREPTVTLDQSTTVSCTPHWYVVKDVNSEDFLPLKNNDFVSRAPWIRSYCAVPLRSGQGSVIGALAIIDDKPRPDVTAHELTLLEELSDTIVQHFHATIIQTQQQRSARLLQGLSAFNAGDQSLRSWWQLQDDARVDNAGRNAVKDSDLARTNRVDAEFGIRQDLFPQGHVVADSTMKDSETPSAHSRRTSDATITRSKVAPVSPIHAAYHRATNLLREALSIDGVAFMNMNSASNKLDQDGATGEMGSDTEMSDGSTEKSRLCEVYSYSTRRIASVDGHGIKESPFQLHEKRLQRLIKHYPNGFVFHFASDGKPENASSDEESALSGSTDGRLKIKRRLSRDVEALGKVFTGVRSAAMYPIWDHGTERWRSCAFVWSESVARYLDSGEDLAYLRTFGHSILAEVSRLESVAADQAKTKFISTVSHELRSPLHAVLAVSLLNSPFPNRSFPLTISSLHRESSSCKGPSLIRSSKRWPILLTWLAGRCLIRTFPSPLPPM